MYKLSLKIVRMKRWKSEIHRWSIGIFVRSIIFDFLVDKRVSYIMFKRGL